MACANATNLVARQLRYIPRPPVQPIPTRNDYQNLYTALSTKFITSENIPEFVRMSFHDLLNFDKSTGSTGAQGCILDDPKIANFTQNNGVRDAGVELKAFVQKEFPTVKYSSGDIVSLAGKVAVEKAFPCLKIKWSFGRRPCTGNEVSGGPEPSINTLEKMKPFLRRYRLSATEMATLTCGAHGIAGAVNAIEDTGIPSFQLATVSSGADFVQKTVNTKFLFFGTWYGAASNPSSLGRFQSDMLFFPTTLRKIAGAVADPSPELRHVEKKLISYNDASFNKAFGEVFAKMLLIGTDGTRLTPFSEGSSTCKA